MRKTGKLKNPPGGCAVRDAESTLVLFAGGGTGGHLMPALATAQAIKDIDPFAECVFLLSRRSLESFGELLRDFRTFTAPELRWLGPRSSMHFAINSGVSMKKALEVFRRNRPDVVVGMGGWGCAPAIFSSKVMRIPSMIFEANAVPGRAVRALAPFCDAIQLQWENDTNRFGSCKKIPSGTPVRPALFGGDRREACRKYNLDPFRTTMLAMGGTQGALALNKLLTGALSCLGTGGKDMQVLHITGEEHLGELTKYRPPENITYRAIAFEPQMRDAFAVADFAMCRAGGGTLAELSALGVPSILVPYPYATDGHQLANSQKLGEAGAAFIAEQHKLTSEKLASIINTLLEHKDIRMRMKNGALSAGRPRAAWEIAGEILKLSREKCFKPEIEPERAAFNVFPGGTVHMPPKQEFYYQFKF